MGRIQERGGQDLALKRQKIKNNLEKILTKKRK